MASLEQVLPHGATHGPNADESDSFRHTFLPSRQCTSLQLLGCVSASVRLLAGLATHVKGRTLALAVNQAYNPTRSSYPRMNQRVSPCLSLTPTFSQQERA